MSSRITGLYVRAWTLIAGDKQPRRWRKVIHDLRTDDRGSGTAEMVIIIGFVVLLAVGIGALITSKVMGKALHISF